MGPRTGLGSLDRRILLLPEFEPLCRSTRSQWLYRLLYRLSFSVCALNTPWREFTSELYRQIDCRLSAKLVPTFTDRICYVVSVTDPYGRILGFLDRRPVRCRLGK
jgi:hypothetical protein